MWIPRSPRPRDRLAVLLRPFVVLTPALHQPGVAVLVVWDLDDLHDHDPDYSVHHAAAQVAELLAEPPLAHRQVRPAVPAAVGRPPLVVVSAAVVAGLPVAAASAVQGAVEVAREFAAYIAAAVFVAAGRTPGLAGNTALHPVVDTVARPAGRMGNLCSCQGNLCLCRRECWDSITHPVPARTAYVAALPVAAACFAAVEAVHSSHALPRRWRVSWLSPAPLAPLPVGDALPSPLHSPPAGPFHGTSGRIRFATGMSALLYSGIRLSLGVLTRQTVVMRHSPKSYSRACQNGWQCCVVF